MVDEKEPVELTAEDRKSAEMHHTLALIHGFNEMATKATVLGEKVYYRLARDAAEKRFNELGGQINRIEEHAPILVIPGHVPEIRFDARDIELMRQTVAEYDAAHTQRASETLPFISGIEECPSEPPPIDTEDGNPANMTVRAGYLRGLAARRDRTLAEEDRDMLLRASRSLLHAAEQRLAPPDLLAKAIDYLNRWHPEQVAPSGWAEHDAEVQMLVEMLRPTSVPQTEPILPDAWKDQDDKPLPEDEAIEAAFPTRSGRHDLYAEARRLVRARYSKGGLVALVNWLLHRAEQEPALRDQATVWLHRFADEILTEHAYQELASILGAPPRSPSTP